MKKPTLSINTETESVDWYTQRLARNNYKDRQLDLNPWGIEPDSVELNSLEKEKFTLKAAPEEVLKALFEERRGFQEVLEALGVEHVRLVTSGKITPEALQESGTILFGKPSLASREGLSLFSPQNLISTPDLPTITVNEENILTQCGGRQSITPANAVITFSQRPLSVINLSSPQ